AVNDLRRAGYNVLFDDTLSICSKITGNVVLRMKERYDGLYSIITESQPSVQCLTEATWHQKLGHTSNDKLRILAKSVPQIETDQPSFCDTCKATKMKQDPYPPSASRATLPLERLHIDI